MKFPRKAAALKSAMTAAVAATMVLCAGAASGAGATNSAGSKAIGVKFGAFFSSEQKKAVRHAFAQKYAKAKECPAGLEKKGKTCASPWDTRYWAVGQELQPAVEVYPVTEIAPVLPPVPQG